MNRQTPWGFSDHAEELAPGIVFYSTPGHGGFYVEPVLNQKIIGPLGTFPGFQTFCGQAGWYEEDCDFAAVALTFPTLFPGHEEAAESRRAYLQSHCPQLPEHARPRLQAAVTRLREETPCAHVSPDVAAAFGLDKLAEAAPHLVKVDLPNTEPRPRLKTSAALRAQDASCIYGAPQDPGQPEYSSNE